MDGGGKHTVDRKMLDDIAQVSYELGYRHGKAHQRNRSIVGPMKDYGRKFIENILSKDRKDKERDGH